METGVGTPQPSPFSRDYSEGEFFIDNLLVRIHFIIVMIRLTGLAPWEFAFPFQGSLTATFLVERNHLKKGASPEALRAETFVGEAPALRHSLSPNPHPADP
jgi:hypothetical protein